MEEDMFGSDYVARKLAARNLDNNLDFVKLFKEELFTTRKNELVSQLGVPRNLVDTETREKIVLELSHIAYVESYINNLIEDTNH